VSHPLRRVAIVGSGPSGFYLAEALDRLSLPVAIDVIDKLPTPFGLVRGGVAPDHPKIKSIATVFERIALRPNVRFLGNIEVGRDIELHELRDIYDVVVLAYGAERDRRLGIPGEDLVGSHSAGEFVGWYNGHPAHADRTFDLSHEAAVVIGLGNVAADICRILLRPLSELAVTDIADHALDALAASRIHTVHLVGRRDPADVKFSMPELRELASISGCAAVMSEAHFSGYGQEHSLTETQKKNLAFFQDLAARASELGKKKQLRFHFWKSPLALVGDRHVEKIRLRRNGSEVEELPCGLVVRCIGFRGTPVSGIAVDETTGTIPNCNGRVTEEGKIIPGLFVVGWLKRGPSGTIGSNRADSFAVAEEIAKDWPRLPTRSRGEDLFDLVQARQGRAVSFQRWKKIDEKEVLAGAPHGRPRRKLVTVDDLLRAAEV